MGSLYDTTMKREKMIHDFEQLLAQYRAYFKDADIDIDGNAPELMLYKEALRIYTSLPQMKNIDPLCILEGEYDLLRSILSDMQTGYKKGCDLGHTLFYVCEKQELSTFLTHTSHYFQTWHLPSSGFSSPSAANPPMSLP